MQPISCTFVNMSKKTEKLLARELYLATGLNRKELADRVGVSDKTMGKWVREGGWDDMRMAQQVTRDKLLRQAYTSLDRINREIENRGGIPDKVLNDAKSTAVREIQTLEKNDGLSSTVAVMESFLSYLYSQNPNLAREVAPIQLKYVETKANESSR